MIKNAKIHVFLVLKYVAAAGKLKNVSISTDRLNITVMVWPTKKPRSRKDMTQVLKLARF